MDRICADRLSRRLRPHPPSSHASSAGTSPSILRTAPGHVGSATPSFTTSTPALDTCLCARCDSTTARRCRTNQTRPNAGECQRAVIVHRIHPASKPHVSPHWAHYLLGNEQPATPATTQSAHHERPGDQPTSPVARPPWTSRARWPYCRSSSATTPRRRPQRRLPMSHVRPYPQDGCHRRHRGPRRPSSSRPSTRAWPPRHSFSMLAVAKPTP